MNMLNVKDIRDSAKKVCRTGDVRSKKEERDSGSGKKGYECSLEHMKPTILDCPICLKKCQTLTTRINHLKSCAKKNGYTVDKLKDTILLQERQLKERQEAGLAIAPEPANRSNRTKSSDRLVSRLQPKDYDEAALHMAVAVSKSEFAEKQKLMEAKDEQLVRLGILRRGQSVFVQQPTVQPKLSTKPKTQKGRINDLLKNTDPETRKKMVYKRAMEIIQKKNVGRPFYFNPYPMVTSSGAGARLEPKYLRFNLSEKENLWSLSSFKSTVWDGKDSKVMSDLPETDFYIGCLSNTGNIADNGKSKISTKELAYSYEGDLGVDNSVTQNVSVVQLTESSLVQPNVVDEPLEAVPCTEQMVMSLVVHNATQKAQAEESGFATDTSVHETKFSTLNNDMVVIKDESLEVDFERMLFNDALSDLTIDVRGSYGTNLGLIRAHKFILYSRCFPLFQAIGKSGDEIVINDTTLDAVKMFVSYLYCGFLKLCSANSGTVTELRKLSVRYDLVSLQDKLSICCPVAVDSNPTGCVLEIDTIEKESKPVVIDWDGANSNCDDDAKNMEDFYQSEQNDNSYFDFEDAARSPDLFANASESGSPSWSPRPDLAFMSSSFNRMKPDSDVLTSSPNPSSSFKKRLDFDGVFDKHDPDLLSPVLPIKEDPEIKLGKSVLDAFENDSFSRTPTSNLRLGKRSLSGSVDKSPVVVKKNKLGDTETARAGNDSSIWDGFYDCFDYGICVNASVCSEPSPKTTKLSEFDTSPGRCWPKLPELPSLVTTANQVDKQKTAPASLSVKAFNPIERKASATQLPPREKNVHKITPITKPTNKKARMKAGSPITPLPHYSIMETPVVMQHLNKFGVRKLPKKKGVKLLKHIYDSTHPFSETDTSFSDGANQRSPKFTSQKLTRSQPTVREAARQIGTNLDSSGELDLHSDSDLSDCANVAGLKVKVNNYIKGKPTLYKQILTYQPIIVEDFHKELRSAGIKPSLSELKDCLDELCVTFRMNMKSKEAKKHKSMPAKRYGKH